MEDRKIEGVEIKVGDEISRIYSELTGGELMHLGFALSREVGKERTAECERIVRELTEQCATRIVDDSESALDQALMQLNVGVNLLLTFIGTVEHMALLMDIEDIERGFDG